MSHKIIIIGRDGEAYEYYPPHEGEGGGIENGGDDESNTLLVAYLGGKEVEKQTEKLLKDSAGEAPPEVIAEYEALIGEH